MTFEQLKAQLAHRPESQKSAQVKSPGPEPSPVEIPLDHVNPRRFRELQINLHLNDCFAASDIDALTDQLTIVNPHNKLGKTFHPMLVISFYPDLSVVDESRKTPTPPDTLVAFNVISLGHIKVGFTGEGALIVAGGKEDKLIPEQAWRSSPSIIESALEEAYLNPKRTLVVIQPFKN